MQFDGREWIAGVGCANACPRAALDVSITNSPSIEVTIVRASVTVLANRCK
jgi:hypothetical protein